MRTRRRSESILTSGTCDVNEAIDANLRLNTLTRAQQLRGVSGRAPGRRQSRCISDEFENSLPEVNQRVNARVARRLPVAVLCRDCGEKCELRSPCSLPPSGGNLVGATGFEPATSSSRTKRATKLRHAPIPNPRGTRSVCRFSHARTTERWRARMLPEPRGVPNSRRSVEGRRWPPGSRARRRSRCLRRTHWRLRGLRSRSYPR